jgi:hypothetical protein
MSIDEFYHQIENIKYLKNIHGKKVWVQVSGNRNLNGADACFWAALIPIEDLESVYQDYSFDNTIGTQAPCFVESGGKVTYEKSFYGNNRSENIVHYREFYGIKPSYVELSEEFRLLNNLYFDTKNNKYFAILNNGESEEVAKIENETNTYVKLKYLTKYSAAKQMALLLFFDIRTKIPGSLRDNNLVAFSKTVKKDDLFYGIWGGEMKLIGSNVFSVIMGKKIIKPKPIEQSGYWPFEEETQYQDYIIGVDENGDPESYTSNPDKLANYFGSNPNAPHYLTPVFFKKEVLQKYLSHPEIYSVEDGRLRCQYLWGMAIDNHHKNCISAYLGDLGRDLPSEEQLHWKSYNIVSEENLSMVKFKRDFLCVFTEAEIIDLKFKVDYKKFQEKWQKKYGWDFFLPLSAKDAYNFKQLRIPVTNSQEEFDHLVLSLVKSIIDSLNEKEILKQLDNPEGLKGSIAKLERFLSEKDAGDYEIHIKFLRNLQELRSTGTGHRKGKSYEKIAHIFNIRDDNFSDAFESILQCADDLILFLINGLL